MPSNPKTRENLDNIIGSLRESRDGMYITEIANKIKLSKAIVYYIIFGQKKTTKKEGEKTYGAYLRDEIEDRQEGRNRRVWLKRGKR